MPVETIGDLACADMCDADGPRGSVAAAHPAYLWEMRRLDEERAVRRVSDLDLLTRVMRKIAQYRGEGPGLDRVLEQFGLLDSQADDSLLIGCSTAIREEFSADKSSARWKPCPWRSTRVSVGPSWMLTENCTLRGLTSAFSGWTLTGRPGANASAT